MSRVNWQLAMGVASEALSIGADSVPELNLTENVPEVFKEHGTHEEDWYHSSGLAEAFGTFDDPSSKEWKKALLTASSALSILSDWHVEEVELTAALPECFGATMYLDDDEEEMPHSTWLLSQEIKKLAESIE